MTVVVFLGPTLPREEAAGILPAEYRPPASRGDVYAAAQSRPWAIAIVDGFFHRVPSVLHKEILWAMSRGIHVYGAASMGALRAAELERFGMVGVGGVFEAFRDGTLTDDDEVAVVHGPPESGYLLGSEAMVNIRATLARAVEAGIIAGGARDSLIALAKELFYADRSWERILRAANGTSVSPEECARFSAWLGGNRGDLKREDALAMLRRIDADRRASGSPKRVEFQFNSTTMWEAHCKAFSGLPGGASTSGVESLGDELLDELRLRGDDYVLERERALNRVLAAELAVRQGEARDPAGDVAAARRRHRLEDEATVERWLDGNALTPEEFTGLMHDEAQHRAIRERYRGRVAGRIHDSLRLRGAWAGLSARAREKERLLSRRGLSSPSLADAGLTEDQLWHWYFVTVLGRGVPDDLEAFAASRDYADLDLMRRAALREFLYRRLDAPAGAPQATGSAHE